MTQPVQYWLETGEFDFFLGYRRVDGHPLPHGFVKARLEEIEDLVESAERYPLEKYACHLAAIHPELTIGLPARNCTQRAVQVLEVFNQLKPGQVKTIPLGCCPSDLHDRADCSYLKPGRSGPYKVQVGIDNNLLPEALDGLESGERLGRWMYEFQKCIKCYGCRNICPVCFCKTCSLEEEELVAAGTLIPEVPIFHLVRAVHMAGRCIDCGLCEEACPMNIPLRLLYRKVNEIMSARFDYKAGTSPLPPPLNFVGDPQQKG